MKLTKKLLGIAAIFAVIGFIVLPLTGCPEAGDNNDKKTRLQLKRQQSITPETTLKNLQHG